MQIGGQQISFLSVNFLKTPYGIIEFNYCPENNVKFNCSVRCGGS